VAGANEVALPQSAQHMRPSDLVHIAQHYEITLPCLRPRYSQPLAEGFLSLIPLPASSISPLTTNINSLLKEVCQTHRI
jgi:hypothetical protein